MNSCTVCGSDMIAPRRMDIGFYSIAELPALARALKTRQRHRTRAAVPSAKRCGSLLHRVLRVLLQFPGLFGGRVSGILDVLLRIVGGVLDRVARVAGGALGVGSSFLALVLDRLGGNLPSLTRIACRVL